MTSIQEKTDPTRRPDWDARVLATPGYSVFHSAGWHKSLSESYRYHPCAFTIRGDDRFLGLLSILEIRSAFTGRRGVSLPFTDECEPIGRGDGVVASIWEEAIRYGRQAGWKYLEIRGGDGGFGHAPAYSIQKFHTLDLTRGEQHLYSQLRGSTRRNIKKGVKQGVTVRISRSRSALDDFCRLNTITRKKHGIPPQPALFFGKLFEHMISRGEGFVCLALHREKPIAGAVFLQFGTESVYKYGASDPAYLNMRPNNQVIWEGIRHLVQSGFHRLHLGRTEPGHTGLLQFKRGWGAEEETKSYYRYDFRRGEFVSQKAGARIPFGLVERCPLPVLTAAGNFLYRHVG